MKTKHTKGKWIASPENNILIDGHIVAFESTEEFDFEQQKANAKLIAEAPNLLEVLQEILKTMQEANINSIEDATHIIGKIGNRALSAIKKATD
jgi:hypothetical protein